MKYLAVLFFVIANRAFPLKEWDVFKTTYGKKYKTEEEGKRMEIFWENQRLVDEHNKNYNKGLVSFQINMNFFGDMTAEEVRETSMKRLKDNHTDTHGPMFVRSVELGELPDSVNWVQEGAVSPIQNQGQCSSSWAFSSIGSLEGQAFKKTGKLVPLSVQNLLDCSVAYGNKGCDGGMAPYAYNYIRDNGGVDSEDFYPYEGHVGLCRFKSTYISGEDAGYTNIPRGDEDALQEAVATVGPIAAVVDGSQSSFQLYSGGIYYSEECKSEMASHSVLIVGYGVQDGLEYWLVKNSWGEAWGEDGYIKMARDKKNNCGIASLATYPIVQ